jgi:uncharacterized protein Yka (UPF0111/DUF47 family)
MGFPLFDVLLPKEKKFYTLFDRQAALLADASRTFKTFLAQLEELSEDDVKKRLWLIRDLELRADELETTIVDELNKTFLTPFDREDVLALATRLDSVIDGFDATARKIGAYHIRKASSRVCKFADLLVDAALELQTLLGLFRTKDETYASIERIHQLESRADDLFYDCMAELFAKEDGVKLLKLKELYEALESVMDGIDTVAKTVRGIVVKQG